MDKKKWYMIPLIGGGYCIMNKLCEADKAREYSEHDTWDAAYHAACVHKQKLKRKQK